MANSNIALQQSYFSKLNYNVYYKHKVVGQFVPSLVGKAFRYSFLPNNAEKAFTQPELAAIYNRLVTLNS